MGGNCMYLPTGDRATSALSICCKMPAEVVAGQNFTYDLEVCNLTGMELQNIVVNYTLDGAKIVSADPAVSGNGFAVGNLAARQCRVIKITANASGTGTVKGCTSATWSNALCCGTNVVQPALAITKAVSPTGDLSVCDNVTYTITVTNTGTGAATNVKVMDQLPAGLTTANGQATVEQMVGTLGPKESKTITFAAKAGKVGTYSNNATASADNGLTAKSNDVSSTFKQATLTITKSCPQMVFLGRPATFKIVVTNTGDMAATNVVVEDTMAQGQMFASASDGGAAGGNVVRWNIGTLAPKASKELTLTSNLSGVNEFCNTARVTANCAQAAEARCCTKTQGVPDLRTALDDGDGVVPIGNNHDYIYSVGNQGQIPLTNVQAKITLPAGLTYVSADPSVTAPAVNGQVVTFNLGTLAPQANKTFKFTVKGTQVGEVLVISETTCAELKTSVRDDEVTNFVER
jgi:uncharacterized repeat protein (TIGR01451 family)